MKPVTVTISIFNHAGMLALELCGVYLSDGEKLLKNAEGETWRDLFVEGFLLPSPGEADPPELVLATGDTIKLTVSDIYKGTPPRETLRRYGPGFYVKVVGKPAKQL